MNEWGAIATVVILAVALVGSNLWQMWRATVRPGALEKMERTVSSQSNRMDRQSARIDALEAEIDELREGRANDHALLQEWIAYARKLAARFKELTGEEPPPEPATKQPASPRLNRATLSRLIAQKFSTDEIDGLAFDMGNTDELTGDTRTARARALVSWAADRGLLADLGRHVEEARPSK